MSQDGKGKEQQNSNLFVTSWKKESHKTSDHTKSPLQGYLLSEFIGEIHYKGKTPAIALVSNSHLNSNCNQITHSSFLEDTAVKPLSCMF